MESKKLLALAKECPNVIISITVSDLIEANEALIRKTKAELEQLITGTNTETYPSPDQVAKILGVDKSTLWRWAKVKVSDPIEIGGKHRFG
ncbi:hypothetical protein Barb7_02299 [Bacteroidales bacterium Barb7]|nr:hypothetical protein Barb7_02299 [Bacteroidales bacterium Barb7]